MKQGVASFSAAIASLTVRPANIACRMQPDVNEIDVLLTKRLHLIYRAALLRMMSYKNSEKAQTRYEKTMISTINSNYAFQHTTTILLNVLTSWRLIRIDEPTKGFRDFCHEGRDRTGLSISVNSMSRLTRMVFRKLYGSTSKSGRPEQADPK